jgi:hypothetical protein
MQLIVMWYVSTKGHVYKMPPYLALVLCNYMYNAQ